jgi:hypothetical protein
LTASQTALAVIEGESKTARVRLAESDARVTGRIFRRNPIPPLFCFIVLLLMISSFIITALTEELEALLLVMNNVVGALNARGDLLVNRPQDIPCV